MEYDKDHFHRKLNFGTHKSNDISSPLVVGEYSMHRNQSRHILKESWYELNSIMAMESQ